MKLQETIKCKILTMRIDHFVLIPSIALQCIKMSMFLVKQDTANDGMARLQERDRSYDTE